MAPLVTAVGLFWSDTGQAAKVPPPQAGDVFLGVRVTGGQGAGESYLVNLGPYSQFTNGGSVNLSALGNLGADLSGKYGDDWHTREDLSWGIFGRSGATVTTLFCSKHRPSTEVQSTPWPSLGTPARDSTGSQISAVWEGSIGSYYYLEATTNSPVAAFQPNSTLASSYEKQVATLGTTDFGSLSQWTSIEANFENGVDGAILDLYRIGSTGVTSPGYFKISAAGVVTFTPSGGGGGTPTLTVNGSLTAFSTTQGTPSFPQTFTVSGSNLTATVAVSPPSGFEVSTDGIGYHSQVTLTTSSGSLAPSTVYVRVAASASVGALGGNISVASSGATTQSVPVSATVDSVFQTWASSYGLSGTNALGTADPDSDGFANGLEFSFGTPPNAGNAALFKSEKSQGGVLFTFLARAANEVSYQVLATPNLGSPGAWTNAGVTITNGPATPTPPEGYTRKQFTVPATGKQFFRIEATILNP
ncbi:MAG: hypothetical protein IAE97_13530 [Chthoniobacterales bacterium]|nr:hypothetical protein [Chthoniobacterales bacterium]